MRWGATVFAIMAVSAIGVPLLAGAVGASTQHGRLGFANDAFTVAGEPIELDPGALDTDLWEALISLLGDAVTIYFGDDVDVVRVVGGDDPGGEVSLLVAGDAEEGDGHAQDREHGDGQHHGSEAAEGANDGGQEVGEVGGENGNGAGQPNGGESVADNADGEQASALVLEGVLDRYSAARFAVGGEPLVLGPPWYVTRSGLWAHLEGLQGQHVTVHVDEHGHLLSIDGLQAATGTGAANNGPPPWVGDRPRLDGIAHAGVRRGPPSWVIQMLPHLTERFEGANATGPQDDVMESTSDRR